VQALTLSNLACRDDTRESWRIISDGSALERSAVFAASVLTCCVALAIFEGCAAGFGAAICDGGFKFKLLKD
jgi:hypothetical protein